MTSSTARGYDYKHEQQRAAWAPRVDAGQAWCHARRCLAPTRWIEPGTAWDLGHNAQRTAWTGPEHAHCNRVDGGRRGAATTMARYGPLHLRRVIARKKMQAKERERSRW